MSASQPQASEQQIVQRLRQQLPQLLAVYLFGSHASGQQQANSDLDLAVLTTTTLAPLQLWQLATELAEQLNMDVDLLDLRAASTVMQYQVINHGRCLWAADSSVALYEAAILSDKTTLDEARQPLLDAIAQRGEIHGR